MYSIPQIALWQTVYTYIVLCSFTSHLDSAYKRSIANTQLFNSLSLLPLLLVSTLFAMPPRRAPSQGSIAPSRAPSPPGDADDVGFRIMKLLHYY